MEHFFNTANEERHGQGSQSAEDKEIPEALPVLDVKSDIAPQNADPGMDNL